MQVWRDILLYYIQRNAVLSTVFWGGEPLHLALRACPARCARRPICVTRLPAFPAPTAKMSLPMTVSYIGHRPWLLLVSSLPVKCSSWQKRSRMVFRLSHFCKLFLCIDWQISARHACEWNKLERTIGVFYTRMHCRNTEGLEWLMEPVRFLK